jgi:peptidyl-prolyl cis-trans isomerase A (cyclophilin A)
VPAQDIPTTVSVTMQTSLGSLLLELETARAPITAANFLRYVDLKRFDGIDFYRALKVGDSGDAGLIQAGLRGNPKRVFKPIAHESTAVTGLSHTNGAISMARGMPGTATSDFFIVFGDLSGLDATAADPGYAVFGRVTEGMDVVTAILSQPTSATAGSEVMRGQMLEKPVRVVSVRRTPTPLSAPH